MKTLTALLVSAIATATVHADLFGFDAVTANDTNGTAQVVGESQLFMDATVIDSSHSSVLFSNTGPANSSITEIYFGSDLTTLNLNIDSVISSSTGVNFDITGATPSNPPGFEEFSYWWSITIAAAESDPPAAKNGIDPLEHLDLAINYTSDSTLAELLQSGELQVALHVVDMGADGEFSETFVNNNYVVPEPASAVLLGAASGLIVFARRRFII